MNALQQLNDWVQDAKGRYVNNFCVGNGYGATCWSLTIGNTDVEPPSHWFKEEGWATKHNRAEIYASEVSFFECSEDTPPNILVANDDDWLGPEDLIVKTLAKAKELGL